MSTAPVLSIVLPVHNVEAYLPDMLVSVERNADPDFEVIVVDDGSDDATPQVIEQFADRLPLLQVVRHEQAAGLADARNAGLDRARGRYVTFLDGDDWLAPDYLRRLVESIERLDCDFVRVDHVVVRGRERVEVRAPEARRNSVLDPRSGILPANRRTMVDYPYAWAGIYRRDLAGMLRFPGHLHTAEDRPWIWRLHRTAGSYAVVSLAGVFYRRLRPTSLTQIGDARQLHFLDAYALVLAQVADDPVLQPKAIRQFLAVLAHHRKLQARFARAEQVRLRRQARDILSMLPAPAVRAAMPRDARAEILHSVLPRTVRRLPVVS